MPDDLEKWYTVQQLAAIWHRSPKTVRRLLTPFRPDCLRVREGKNPRRILWVPRRVATAIEQQLRLTEKGCQEKSA